MKSNTGEETLKILQLERNSEAKFEKFKKFSHHTAKNLLNLILVLFPRHLQAIDPELYQTTFRSICG